MSTSSQNPEPGRQPEAPSPLSPERLAEIRERVSAEHLTAAPWTADDWEINGPSVWVGETCDVDSDDKSRANAKFIAHARQDVPVLLAEVDRLSKLVESMVAAVTGFDCPDPNMGPLETVVSVTLALIEAEQRVAALARFKERLTEEVKEFEDAARDDPNTPQVARLMIANLRLAMGGTS